MKYQRIFTIASGACCFLSVLSVWFFVFTISFAGAETHQEVTTTMIVWWSLVVASAVECILATIAVIVLFIIANIFYPELLETEHDEETPEIKNPGEDDDTVSYSSDSGAGLDNGSR